MSQHIPAKYRRADDDDPRLETDLDIGAWNKSQDNEILKGHSLLHLLG